MHNVAGNIIDSAVYIYFGKKTVRHGFFKNIFKNIVINITDYSAILLTLLFISNIAANFAGNIDSNNTDSIYHDYTRIYSKEEEYEIVITWWLPQLICGGVG